MITTATTPIYRRNPAVAAHKHLMPNLASKQLVKATIENALVLVIATAVMCIPHTPPVQFTLPHPVIVLDTTCKDTVQTNPVQILCRLLQEMSAGKRPPTRGVNGYVVGGRKKQGS